MLTVFSSPSSLRSDLVKLAARPLTLRLSKRNGTATLILFFLVLPQILMLAATEASWQTRQALPMEEQVEELEPPFLLTQTGSASIPINASFELFVEASGSEPLHYQWFFNEVPIEDAQTTKLFFETFQAEQVGHYHITVSNAAGITQSAPMTLSLNPSLTPEQILIDWDAKYESDEGSNVFPVKAFHDGLGGSLSAGTFYSKEDQKSRFLIATHDAGGTLKKASFPSYSDLSREQALAAMTLSNGWIVVGGRSRLPLDGDPAVDPKPIEFPFLVAVNTQGEEKWRHASPALRDGAFDTFQWLDLRQGPGDSLFLLGQATRGDEDRFFMERMDVPGGQSSWFRWLDSEQSENSPWTPNGLGVHSQGRLYLSSTRVDDAGVLLESKITAFDLSGDFLWETSSTALGLGPLQPIDMLQTANGATYVVHERWNTPEDADIEIWLLNASGTLLWRQIIALPDGTAERPSAMKVNHRGDLILAGTTETALQGRQILLGTLQQDGTSSWFVLLPPSMAGAEDKVTDLAIDDQDSIILVANRAGVASGGDIATIKFNREGSLVWEARFSEPELSDQIASGVEWAQDDGLILSGFTQVGDETRMITLKQSIKKSQANELPQASWVREPFAGTLAGPGSWVAELITSDKDGSVTRVDFLQDNQFHSSDSEPPFSMTFEARVSGTTTYYARIFDDQGGVNISGALHVTVKVTDENIPFFTKPMDPFILSGQDPITLDPGVSALPPLRLQWFLNGQRLEGETGLALEIPSPQMRSHSGTYTLRAQNDAGRSISTPVVVSLDWPFESGGDLFSEPVEMTGNTGQLRSSNVGATAETDEPTHAHRPGGSSVWFRWRPTETGLARISLEGSSFDTLLAVYAGSSIQQLTRVTENDDSEGDRTSRVIFDVFAGVDYLIAMDGFLGAEGNILMDWTLEPEANASPDTSPLPTRSIRNRDLAEGASIVLDYGLIAPSTSTYQWYRNGHLLGGATGKTLRVAEHFTRQHAGRYTLAVKTPEQAWLSPSSDLSLDWPVQEPRDAFGDAMPLTGDSGHLRTHNRAMSQEEGEPLHARITGGHSIWFEWTPSESGHASVSLEGSSLDTLLTAYQGQTIDQLTTVGHDADGGNLSTSQLEFAVQAGESYRIAVDGFNGQTGNILMSWHLEPGVDSIAVVISPKAPSARWGHPYQLEATIAPWNETYQLQWHHNGIPIEGANSAILSFESMADHHTGYYTLAVKTSSDASVSQTVSLSISLPGPHGKFSDLTLAEKFGTLYEHVRTHDPEKPRQASEPPSPSPFISAYSGKHLVVVHESHREMLEPFHDSELGAASAWFAFQPPVDGILALNLETPSETAALGVYQAQGPSFPEIKDHLGTLTTLKEPQEIGKLLPVHAKETYFIAVEAGREAIPEIMTLSHELLIDMAIEPIFPTTAKPSFQISTPPGIPFMIEGSVDLLEWTIVEQERALDGQYTFDNHPSLDQPYQFFRVRTAN